MISLKMTNSEIDFFDVSLLCAVIDTTCVKELACVLAECLTNLEKTIRAAATGSATSRDAKGRCFACLFALIRGFCLCTTLDMYKM